MRDDDITVARQRQQVQHLVAYPPIYSQHCASGWFDLYLNTGQAGDFADPRPGGIDDRIGSEEMFFAAAAVDGFDLAT